MTAEELGMLQFADEEIAVILGRRMTKKDHCDAKRGRLKAEAEVRQAILTMAKQGSTPAQKQVIELIQRRDGGDTDAGADLPIYE